MRICSFMKTNRPPRRSIINSRVEPTEATASKSLRAAGRGSTSTWTSAKPAAALRSLSLSRTVPAHEMREQPGTIVLSRAPFFSVYSTRPGDESAMATDATRSSSSAVRKAEALAGCESQASGAASKASWSALLRAFASTVARSDRANQPEATRNTTETVATTRKWARRGARKRVSMFMAARQGVRRRCRLHRQTQRVLDGGIARAGCRMQCRGLGRR